MERRETPDFFVSYTSADRTWAEWIAWELEAAGYRALIQAWDFGPGTDFVAGMRDATSGSARTVAVLSPAYLDSEFAVSEWDAAYAADPLGRAGKLVPVRVAEVDVRGLDAVRVWIDLVGCDEDEARRRLLAGLGTGRAKPGRKPTFPMTSAPRFPGSLPRVWNLTHHQNPNFTGRAELLAAIEASAETTVLTQAITGLGGVGKTQLAAEYAYRHRDDYDVVWWVRAETPLTMAQDMAALAGALGIETGTELDAAVAAARSWLEGHDRWLLVFDNALHADAVEALMPRGGGGRVLVTSRDPNWGGVATVLPVDVLPPEQAVSLLVRRSGDQDTSAAAVLADELGCLPLALEQAAAFVAATPGMTLRGYLDLFRTRAAELLARGHAAAIATTWNLALETLEHTSPDAAELLQFCSFLDPDDIPLGLILPDADPLAFADALAQLGRFSLVTHAGGDLVSVHRLVQRVVRERLPEPERRAFSFQVVMALAGAFPRESSDVRTWDQCAVLLPHALAATALVEAPDRDTVEPMGSLLSATGSYLERMARYPEARRLFERALSIAEADYGSEHSVVAVCLSNLATVAMDLGDPAGARPLVERALRIQEAAHGRDHPTVGVCLSILALVLQELGNPAGARPLIERALAIDEVALGPDHPAVGTRLSNLALVLIALREPGAALLLLERALAIDERAFGPDHPAVGTDLNNLAGALRDLGDHAAARHLFERALAIALGAYAPHHPTVATRLNNLALVLQDLGDPAAARPLFERALAIAEAAYGPDHPKVGGSLNNLAMVLKDLGDLAAVRPLLERALAIDDAALGPDHPMTQAIRANLDAVCGAD